MLNSTKLCRVIYRHNCVLLNKSQASLLSINSPLFLKFLSSLNALDDVQKNYSGFLKSISATPLARYLSTKKQKSYRGKDADEEDDENSDLDDEDDEDEIKVKGVEVKTYSLLSLRVDLLLKTSLGCNRRRIEDLFFEKKLRVNGQLLLKKGINAKTGDEFDIIKDFAPQNPNFLNITRVEVLKIKFSEEDERFLVKIRKTKSLLVENYDDKNKYNTV